MLSFSVQMKYLSPVMNVSHELLAGVGTLCLVVADEDGDGVDGESSEESAALETADWGRGGEMVQLLLVGHSALQPVVSPVALGHSHHAEEAGVSAGLAPSLLPAEAGGEPGQAGGQAALGGGAGGEGGDLMVDRSTSDYRSHMRSEALNMKDAAPGTQGFRKKIFPLAEFLAFR